jgi:ATP/maltotriose-dependent transcriptional regulator MalT
MGTNPLTPLAILATIRGDYAEAASLGEQARQASEALADKQNLSFSHYVLTSAFLAQGKHEAAQQHAQQAYATARAAGNRWFLAYCLNEWGNVERALGNHAEARRHFQASYAIRQEFDDPEGMAVALGHLGQIAILEQDYHQADDLYRQSLGFYREIGDRGGLATSLAGLGDAALALGKVDEAGKHLHQALQVATEIQFLPLAFSLSISAGRLLLHTGQGELSATLLTFVAHHPASDGEAKERAEQLLARCQAQLQPEQFASAEQTGLTSTLEDVLALLLSGAMVPSEGDRASPLLPTAQEQPPDQALIEPLTPRELDVLRLLADGLSNKEIATELVLTLGTVKWYNNQIYGKLNVKSRTQAIARASELSLLP